MFKKNFKIKKNKWKLRFNIYISSITYTFISLQKNEYKQQINQLNDEKTHLISQINDLQQYKDDQLLKQSEVRNKDFVFQ